MSKFMIRNKNRVNTNQMRLIKTETSNAVIGEQTGAVYQDDFEVGLCLAKYILPTDIKVFPSTRAEFNAFIAANPMADLINPFDLKSIVVTEDDITIEYQEYASVVGTVCVGFSFDKTQIDKCLAVNKTQSYGTLSSYKGASVSEPPLTDEDIDLLTLKNIIENSITFNGRYIWLNNPDVNEEALHKTKLKLELLDEIASCSATVRNIRVNVIHKPNP